MSCHSQRTHISFPTRPSSNLENGGLDTITAFVDSNENHKKDASEPEDTATRSWLAHQPSIALAPKTAENPVGATHTLTATVTDAGTPVEGVLVGFSGNLNLDFFVGRCQESIFGNRFVVSDKNGTANGTYGGVVAGTETITAFADTNKDGALDNGEPSDTATKTWTETPPPPATSLSMTPREIGRASCRKESES